MKPSRSGEKKRGVLRRISLVVLGLAVGAFVLSNLLLGGILEKELGQRTGMDWTVARARWSPWGGVCLSGVRAEVAVDPGVTIAPVLEVGQLRVRPYWGTLFRERRQFRQIEVVEPRGNVPVQLLALLAAPDGVPEVPQVTAPALKPDPDPARPKEKKRPKQKQGKSPKKKPGTDAGKPPAKKTGKKQDKKPDKKPAAEKAPPPVALPSRIRVTGGDLRVYSLGAKGPELRVAGLACDLPVAGPEAKGSVQWAQIAVGDALRFGPFSRELRWKSPYLDLPEEKVEWQGLGIRLGGRAEIRRRARYSVAAQVLPGKMEELALPEWTGLQVGVEEVKTGFFRSEGELRRPGTWVAELVADVRGVRFGQKNWQVGHRFDLGQVVAVFRQGVLQVADARLRSEPVSLMGNGIMVSSGRTWSVVRIVADPEFSRVIQRAAIGSHISRGWVRSWLKPLGTPDRRFRDIHLEGPVTRVMADLGRKGEEIEVRTALRMLRAFLTGEIQEEEIVAPVEGKEGA